MTQAIKKCKRVYKNKVCPHGKQDHSECRTCGDNSYCAHNKCRRDCMTVVAAVSVPTARNVVTATLVEAAISASTINSSGTANSAKVSRRGEMARSRLFECRLDRTKTPCRFCLCSFQAPWWLVWRARKALGTLTLFKAVSGFFSRLFQGSLSRQDATEALLYQRFFLVSVRLLQRRHDRKALLKTTKGPLKASLRFL